MVRELIGSFEKLGEWGSHLSILHHYAGIIMKKSEITRLIINIDHLN